MANNDGVPDVVLSLAAGLGYEAERMDEPQLLRIPTKFHTVDDVLGAAKRMNLPNVLVLSELEDGKLVFLETEMTVAEANWLLDRLKTLLLAPSAFERTDR